MSQAWNMRRLDRVRARAILQATRDRDGKVIRTVAEAEAWIDKTQPELTADWLSRGGEPLGK